LPCSFFTLKVTIHDMTCPDWTVDSASVSQQPLKEKVAVISGKIGAQIARGLPACGANIIINYPSPPRGQRAEAVASSLHTPSITVEADITPEGPRNRIKAAVAPFGAIDILVNNSGKAVDLPFEEQTLEHWENLVNLNSRGTLLLTQAALPHLASRG
jgi:NAD(P)-dependent dehydrogenase (short-subunit alcohol dehydrogenase family)